jgi:multiple sugar transport system substrate-binding protein
MDMQRPHTPHSATRRALLRFAGTTAAVPAAVLAACGVGTPGAPAQTGALQGAFSVNYLSFFAGDDPQTISLPYVTQQFVAKYPQAKVEHTTSNGSSAANVMEKYLSLLAAGTPPDVAAVNPMYIEPLWGKSALADLTPFVKRDSKSFQPDDFNEATLLRAVRGGKWHCLPLQMGLYFLFYNQTALSQAGVAKPDVSWTWDKLLESARAIRQRDTNSLGMTQPPYELPLRDNGGDVLTADEKKCLLDQPAAVEAIQWAGDLRQKHHAVPEPAEMSGQAARALFDSGRFAFHLGDPGFLSGTIRGKLSFPWDIAMPPKGKVAQVDTVKGPSFVMSADSKNKDAAWAWLSHYDGPEMQRYVATNGKIVSARKSALKAFTDAETGYTSAVILQAAAIAKPMPYVARFDDMDKEISTGLNAVYGGQKTAKDAMADVVQKVNLILAS